MEEHQMTHITNNLPTLIQLTRVNEILLAELQRKKILSLADTDNILSKSGELEKTALLYRILSTRTGAYDVLISALILTEQSAALHCLIGTTAADHVIRNGDSIQNRAQSLSITSSSSVSLPLSLSSDDKITFDINGVNALLGEGSYGTKVYRGMFCKREVAVKVIFETGDNKQIGTEIEVLLKCDNHENVIRYFAYNYDAQRQCYLIALEYCKGSLDDWMKNKLIIQPAFISKPQILFQATKGIAYLHRLRIVHRDLKPTNILLAVVPGENIARVKIADFGISKNLGEGMSRATVTSVVGTYGWRAPEILRWIDQQGLNPAFRSTTPIKMTRASDIFSLGCVFYYLINDGAHPFGTISTAPANILTGMSTIGTVIGEDQLLGSNPLIRDMVKLDQENRPSASAILFHPIFWSEKTKLQFLVDISNLCENMDEDHPKQRCCLALETKSQLIICSGTNDWTAYTCSVVHNYLKTNKRRKYSGTSVMELIRAIRNMHNHFRNLDPDIQKAVGGIPEGFLNYWLSRFPHLLHYVWVSFQCLSHQLPSEYYSLDYIFSDY